MANWPSGYLIKDRKKSRRAHLWTGNDTICRMWSTGGMGQRRGYSVHVEVGEREICELCNELNRRNLVRLHSSVARDRDD